MGSISTGVPNQTTTSNPRSLPQHPTISAPILSTGELRWAAAALVIGSLLFVRGIVFGLHAFEGEWDTSVGPTLPQTATLIQEKWNTFHSIWVGETLGAVLLALAGFLLQRRAEAPARWLPACLAWISLSIGSIIVAISYGMTLGGYPTALNVFAEEPSLFGVLRGAVLQTHMIGSVLQGLGLAVALLLELRWKGRALPDQLVRVGVGLWLLGIVFAVVGIVPGEYAAAGNFVAAALLGAAIWLRPYLPADS